MPKKSLEQLKQAMAIAMGEYIEHFTQPIWEQGNDDEEEDEGEDEGDWRPELRYGALNCQSKT